MRIAWVFVAGVFVAGCETVTVDPKDARPDAMGGAMGIPDAGGVAIAPDAEPACGVEFLQIADFGDGVVHCYAGQAAANWEDAKRGCEGLEAHLLVIESAAEAAALEDYLASEVTNIWLGGQRVDDLSAVPPMCPVQGCYGALPSGFAWITDEGGVVGCGDEPMMTEPRRMWVDGEPDGCEQGSPNVVANCMAWHFESAPTGWTDRDCGQVLPSICER